MQRRQCNPDRDWKPDHQRQSNSIVDNKPARKTDISDLNNTTTGHSSITIKMRAGSVEDVLDQKH